MASDKQILAAQLITNHLSLITFLMPFDPTLPANNSQIISSELRNQLNALNDKIEAQAAQIADLQSQLANKATNPGMPHMTITFSNPPTATQLNDAQSFINDLVDGLQVG